MRYITKVAMIAAAMTAITALDAPPAAARDHVSVGLAFDDGVVAFGFRDGYWDRDHHWHRWHHSDDWRAYREHHPDHYYAREHDHYRNHGWRD